MANSYCRFVFVVGLFDIFNQTHTGLKLDLPHMNNIPSAHTNLGVQCTFMPLHIREHNNQPCDRTYIILHPFAVFGSVA